MDPLTPRGKGSGEGRPTLPNEGPILMTPGGSFISAKTSQQYFAYSSTASSSTSSAINSPAVHNIPSTIFESASNEASRRASPAATASSSSSSAAGGKLPKGWEMRELFGGAIVCALPASFEDVSIVRQVPDHQEVFVDKQTELSLIVELLQAESPGSSDGPGAAGSGGADNSGAPGYLSDERAAAYYFEDLSQCNDAAESRVESSEVVPACSGQNGGECDFMPQVPPQYTRCALVGRQIVTKFKSNDPSRPKDAVQLLLLVLRLPEVQTDVLVTLNVPYAQLPPGPDGAAAEEATSAVLLQKPMLMSNSLAPADVMKMALHSFKIVDYSLFA